LKKYGAKLIDDPRNLLLIDHGKHLNKSIPKYSERQFCEALDLLHCKYCKGFIKCNSSIDIAFECRGFDFDKNKYEVSNV